MKFPTNYIVDNLTAADILEADPPTHKLSYPGGGMIAMCWLGSDAARLARGLRALEERQPPMFSIDPATANFSDMQLRPGRFLRIKATVTLRESEILARAREATIASGAWGPVTNAAIRAGERDADRDVTTAARALRDLAKPLSEVVPAVDGDLVEARRIVANTNRKTGLDEEFALRIERGDEDQVEAVQAALAAIRRGRELEREAR